MTAFSDVRNFIFFDPKWVIFWFFGSHGRARLSAREISRLSCLNFILNQKNIITSHRKLSQKKLFYKSRFWRFLWRHISKSWKIFGKKLKNYFFPLVLISRKRYSEKFFLAFFWEIHLFQSLNLRRPYLWFCRKLNILSVDRLAKRIWSPFCIR